MHTCAHTLPHTHASPPTSITHAYDTHTHAHMHMYGTHRGRRVCPRQARAGRSRPGRARGGAAGERGRQRGCGGQGASRGVMWAACPAWQPLHCPEPHPVHHCSVHPPHSPASTPANRAATRRGEGRACGLLRSPPLRVSPQPTSLRGAWGAQYLTCFGGDSFFPPARQTPS